jgi:putative membrane protein
MKQINVRRTIGMLLRGFAMGSADVVPGVSGGTVAFVTGIYEMLVGAVSTGSHALQALLSGKFRTGVEQLRSIDWAFLIPLVTGAALAIFTLASVLERLLHEQPTRMAGLFFGLIVGTIYIAWQMVRSPRSVHVVIALVVGGLAFALFGLQSSVVSDPSAPVFIGSGMLAIIAFILPGISGSFILLSIGMYQPVLGAVTDRAMGSLILFALGAVFGLAAFSRVLARLLERHHDVVVAGLIGLMLGSFRILWPWPNGLGDANGIGATVLGAPSGDVAIPLLLAVAGAAFVMGVTFLAERRSAPATR